MAFRKRKLLWFVVPIALLALAIVSLRLPEYSRWQRRGGAIVRSLATRKSAGVKEATWHAAMDWANTAYHNVCFSESHVPLAELKEFVTDAEKELTGPVDMDSVEWLWKRLARTSPHGESYYARCYPMYLGTINRSNSR